jgi:hypothetical protein
MRNLCILSVTLASMLTLEGCAGGMNGMANSGFGTYPTQVPQSNNYGQQHGQYYQTQGQYNRQQYPQQYNQQQYPQQYNQQQAQNNQSALPIGAVLGAAVGGVIANKVAGKGNGKIASTAIGAALGGYVGNMIQEQQQGTTLNGQ